MIITKKKLINKYFKDFNNHNLNELSNNFSKNVHLNDWEINIKGLSRVLKANKKIFKNFPLIKVNIKRIFINKNIVFSTLLIRLKKNKTINVVDMFTINKRNKISKIRAYLG